MKWLQNLTLIYTLAGASAERRHGIHSDGHFLTEQALAKHTPVRLRELANTLKMGKTCSWSDMVTAEMIAELPEEIGFLDLGGGTDGETGQEEEKTVLF